MDGQNRTKLVDSKIVFPHGITLDLVSRLVYWADAYLDYIEVVDYEGKGRQTIIQGILVRGAFAGNPGGGALWGAGVVMSTLGKGRDMASTPMGTVILEIPLASFLRFYPYNDPWETDEQIGDSSFSADGNSRAPEVKGFA